MSIVTETTLSTPPAKRHHGYIFILTPIEMRGKAGTELCPRHRIVKANESQIAEIRNTFQQFNTNKMFMWPYDHDIEVIPGDQPGAFQYKSHPLAFENFRYWIVEFDGGCDQPGLQYACSLIPSDLELGFFFLYQDGHTAGVGSDPSALHTFCQNYGPVPTKVMVQEDLAEIRRLYDEIKNFPQEFVHVIRALRRFDQLKWLSRTSEMIVIGLFSIIESLVSHAPKLTESADSLSHQLRTKLPLLRKRFYSESETSQYFDTVPEETVWSKLYAYRSKIVHGEDSQLNGDLQILKDTKTVVTFLRDTSKRLLVLSLREPQFVTDLKKC